MSSLQHVSSPFPDGERESIRSFYGTLLGLTEVPVPDTLSHMGLVWFSAGPGLELHFFPGRTDSSADRHFCLDVADLAETRKRLVADGREPYDDIPIPGRPRFFCRDPVGNLVEFTTIAR
ncbi:MAG TPA: VOC family protein [Candidatus Dormibacteraeota bacterium]|nr:VOC family protein [Candidatus Dormibacteraeota bacterium]